MCAARCNQRRAHGKSATVKSLVAHAWHLPNRLVHVLVLVAACSSRQDARPIAGEGSGSAAGAVVVAPARTDGQAGAGSAASLQAKAGPAVSELTSRCQTRKDGEACRALGVLYTAGTGVPVDAGKAFQWFEQACTLGNVSGCNHLGVLLIEGEGVAPQPSRGAELLAKACDQNYAVACRNLALAERDGKLGVAQPARVAARLAKACDAAVPFACTNLGDLLMNAAAHDAKQGELAVAAYQAGCQRNEGAACRQLGAAYIDGIALPKSTAAAKVWLQKACDANDGVGCTGLAGLLTTGPNGKSAAVSSQAHALLARACNLGHAPACAAKKTPQ